MPWASLKRAEITFYRLLSRIEHSVHPLNGLAGSLCLFAKLFAGPDRDRLRLRIARPNVCGRIIAFACRYLLWRMNCGVYALKRLIDTAHQCGFKLQYLNVSLSGHHTLQNCCQHGGLMMPRQDGPSC